MVNIKITLEEISLVVQWLGLCLPMQKMWVQSLVGKLKSHIPQGLKNQNMKQKQYCNKFNKKNLKKMIHVKKKKSLG